MELSFTYLFETVRESFPGLSLYLPKKKDPVCGSMRFLRRGEPARAGELNIVPEELAAEAAAGAAADGAAYLLPGSVPEGFPAAAMVYPAGTDRIALAQSIGELFRRAEQWESELLLALLRGAPLQQILEHVTRAVDNPIYLADRNFKMLADVGYIQPEVSAVWRYQKKYGFLPPNVVMDLISSGEIDRINNSPTAIFVRTHSFPKPYIAKSIQHNGKILGYFFIIELFHSLTHQELLIAERLGALLTEAEICQRGSPLSQTNETDQKHFFLDILQGSISEKSQIRERLRFFGWSWTDTYVILTVESRSGTEFLQNNLINMLTEGWNSIGFLYKDRIVVLYRNPQMNWEELLRWIRKHLLAHGFRGALSELFDDFFHVRHYYEQTVFSLEHEKDCDSGLVRFESCYLSYRAGRIGDMPVYRDMQRLWDYDQSHHTEYCRTLYTWLSRERNVVAAADELFLHRNTMKYRLNRIEEVVRLDLDDLSVRERCLDSLFLLLRPDQK